MLRSIATAVAVLCLGGAAAIHADQPDLFNVRVHLRVDRSLAPRLIASDLRDETESLWGPYGVQLDWTTSRLADEPAHGFAVEVSLLPRIAGMEVPEWSDVLGRAFVKLESPSAKPILLSYDAVERLLALRRPSGDTIRIGHDREMARALGRVLAHELGHVLLGAPYHDDAGMMRSSYQTFELTSATRAPFLLSCGSVGRLRSRLSVLNVDPRYAREPHWNELDDPVDALHDGLSRAPCVSRHASR